MKLFELFATLGLDSSGFDSGVIAAGKRFAELGRTIGNGADSIISSVESTVKRVTAIGTASATALAAIGVSYNAQMQKYSVGLQNMLGSAEAAQAAIKAIKQDATNSPFDVSSLVQANQLLISTGESAEDSRAVINALGDAIAATGGDDSTLTRMASNLQQVKNVGKATAMDIRQFAMAGINIYGLLADYTGKTAEEVKDMDVTFGMLEGALIQASQEGGRYFGAMNTQAQTFNGALNKMKASGKQLVGDLFQPMSNLLSDKILPGATKLFNDLDSSYLASGGGLEGIFSGLTMGHVRIRQALSDVDDFKAKIDETFGDGTKYNTVNGIVKAAFNNLNQDLPGFLEIGDSIFQNIRTGFRLAVEGVEESTKIAGADLFSKLVTMKGDFLTTGLDIVGALAKSIAEDLGKSGTEDGSKIEKAIQDGVGNILTSVTLNTPNIVTAGFGMVSSLFSNTAEWINNPDNQGKVVAGLKSLVEASINAVPAVIASGIQIASGLGETLVHAIFGEPDEITQAVQNLYGNYTDIETKIRNAERDYSDTVSDINERASVAKTYLDLLKELDGKETLTEEEANTLKTIQTAITNLFGDDVAGKITAYGSSYRTAAEEIGKFIDAQKLLVLQDAENKLREQYGDINSDALLATTQAKMGLKDAEAILQQQQAKYDEMQRLYEQIMGGNLEFGPISEELQKRINASSWANLSPDGRGKIKDSENWLYFLESLEGAMGETETSIMEAQSNVESFNTIIARNEEIIKSNFSELDGLIAQLRESVQGLTGNINDVPDKTVTITARYVGFGENGPAGSGSGKRSYDEDVLGISIDGERAVGLNYVPFNNYIASLHEGERVLTKAEAERYRSGGVKDNYNAVLDAIDRMAYSIDRLERKQTALVMDRQKVGETMNTAITNRQNLLLRGMGG